MIAFNRQFPFRMSAKKVSPLSPKKTSSRSIKKGDANAINESTKKRKMDPPPFIEPPMLLVKLLSEHGVAPKRETASAAGYDIVRYVFAFFVSRFESFLALMIARFPPKGAISFKQMWL